MARTPAPVRSHSARSLPARPNLDYLKKLAKERLHHLRAAAPGAKLAEAQLLIARDFGFTSWRTLHRHVAALASRIAACHAAAARGDDAELRRLLRENPHLADARSEADRTPLHEAVRNEFRPLTTGHLRVLDTLLRASSEVDALGEQPNLGRCTPLLLACFAGADRAPAVVRLLDAGADPNAASSDGVTPLSTALAHEEREIVAALLLGGAHPTLHDLVALDRIDEVDARLATEPSLVSAVDPVRGYSLLSVARSDAMGRMLRARGARPGIVEAASLGLANDVRAALARDAAGAHARDKQNRTPLHAAAAAGALEVVQLLMDAGADLTAEWVPSWTPLEVARRRGRDEVAAYLQSAEANRRATNAAQDTLTDTIRVVTGPGRVARVRRRH